MRIAACSDLHGALNANAPECDVFAVVGDFMPLLSTAENWKSWQEFDWLKRKGMKWLLRQPAKHKVVIAGNHDICMYAPDTRMEVEGFLREHGIIVLGGYDCASTIIDGVRFTGYSYTPTIQNRNWAYSQARSNTAVKLGTDAIHHETNVLLTHGPPLGLLDGSADGKERYGCAALMHRLLEIGPQLTICGHIHEQRGKRMRYFDLQGRPRKIANVSIMDASYSERGGKVQVFDL